MQYEGIQYEGPVYDSFNRMAGITFGVRKGMEAALREVGLTFPQFGGIMVLGRHGGITQTELAQALQTDTTTTMVICDALQKKGLLRRLPDAHDRRVNRLELTGKGNAALRAAEPLIVAYYGPIQGALSGEEWETLKGLLEKLAPAIKKP
jgi:DNA-binding MarR family transcriptional regulator